MSLKIGTVAPIHRSRTLEALPQEGSVRDPASNACGARERPEQGAFGDFAETDLANPPYLGNVYTPAALARWVASLVAHELGVVAVDSLASDPESKNSVPTSCAPPSRRPSRPVILDFACGDGALLAAMHEATSGNARLFGVDVDASAVRAARSALGPRPRLVRADALLPAHSHGVLFGWRDVMEGRAVDAVIANPPWGADLPHSPEKLRRAGYQLANGQFDSFDLFFELALQLVRRGGIVAFIVPDALFLPEHAPLRHYLADRTELRLVARLGEGFFPGVYRGTAVVVCRNHAPSPTHEVRCVRLSKRERDAVLGGRMLLTEACRRVEHRAPQSRFSRDAEARFDIDVRTSDTAAVSLIDHAAGDWTRRLISGRGVELSKHGVVLFCPRCNAARPKPRGILGKVECNGCGRTYDASSARTERIILPIGQGRSGHTARIMASASQYSNHRASRGQRAETVVGQSPRAADGQWQPIIVGEDVDRYAVTTERHIRLGVPGINYKRPESFSPRKLVIRKTGIGLKVALDETGALTNQVVFHYYADSANKTPAFYLDYVLGVLCSRVLLAYHLKRTGETEWRSHPYVTQQVIASLPVPDIHPGTWQWVQAQAIAAAARSAVAHRADSSTAEAWAADLYVERLVAGLYELRDADCQWVPRVLESAEGLEPIRSVRLPVGTRLEPLRVSALDC